MKPRRERCKAAGWPRRAHETRAQVLRDGRGNEGPAQPRSELQKVTATKAPRSLGTSPCSRAHEARAPASERTRTRRWRAYKACVPAFLDNNIMPICRGNEGSARSRPCDSEGRRSNKASAQAWPGQPFCHGNEGPVRPRRQQAEVAHRRRRNQAPRAGIVPMSYRLSRERRPSAASTTSPHSRTHRSIAVTKPPRRHCRPNPTSLSRVQSPRTGTADGWSPRGNKAPARALRNVAQPWSWKRGFHASVNDPVSPATHTRPARRPVASNDMPCIRSQHVGAAYQSQKPGPCAGHAMKPRVRGPCVGFARKRQPRGTVAEMMAPRGH